MAGKQHGDANTLTIQAHPLRLNFFAMVWGGNFALSIFEFIRPWDILRCREVCRRFSQLGTIFASFTTFINVFYVLVPKSNPERCRKA